MDPSTFLAWLVFACTASGVGLCFFLLIEEPDLADTMGPILLGIVLGVLLSLSSLALFG